MLPIAYNNHYQIVQTPGYVMILVEMVHDVRMIPTDGRPHGNIRRWLGDSVGRWEGDTLVVDTINFKPQVNFRGSSENLHVIERFIRTDAEHDPLQVHDRRSDDLDQTVVRRDPAARNRRAALRYACHEANYGLEGVLRGARAQEKREEEMSQSKKK